MEAAGNAAAAEEEVPADAAAEAEATEQLTASDAAEPAADAAVAADAASEPAAPPPPAVQLLAAAPAADLFPPIEIAADSAAAASPAAGALIYIPLAPTELVEADEVAEPAQQLGGEALLAELAAPADEAAAEQLPAPGRSVDEEVALASGEEDLGTPQWLLPTLAQQGSDASSAAEGDAAGDGAAKASSDTPGAAEGEAAAKEGGAVTVSSARVADAYLAISMAVAAQQLPPAAAAPVDAAKQARGKLRRAQMAAADLASQLGWGRAAVGADSDPALDVAMGRLAAAQAGAAPTKFKTMREVGGLVVVLSGRGKGGGQALALVEAALAGSRGMAPAAAPAWEGPIQKAQGCPGLQQARAVAGLR